MTTSKAKALEAAQRSAQEENWKHATLCMLVATEAHSKPVRAVDVAQQFSDVGIEAEPEIIYSSLDSLVEDGLLGLFKPAA